MNKCPCRGDQRDRGIVEQSSYCKLIQMLRIYAWVEVIAIHLLNGETIPLVCLPNFQIRHLLDTRALILLVSHLAHPGIPFSNFSMNAGISNVVQIHRHPSLRPFHFFHSKTTIFLLTSSEDPFSSTSTHRDGKSYQFINPRYSR